MAGWRRIMGWAALTAALGGGAAAAPLPPTLNWTASFSRTAGGDQNWLAGASASGTTYVVYLAHSYDVRLAAWDPAGAKLLDVPLQNAARAVTSMTVAANGELLLAGEAQGATRDVWVARYDLAGNQLWVATSDSGFDDISPAVAEDAAGNVDVCSWYQGATDNYGRLWQLTGAGASAWTQTALSFGTDTEFDALTTDAAGNIYVAGTVLQSVVNDALIASWDAGGAARWNMSYSFAAFLPETARAISFEPGGSRLFAAADDLYDLTAYEIDPADGTVLNFDTASDTNVNIVGGMAVAPGGGVYVSAFRWVLGNNMNVRLQAFDAALAPSWSVEVDEGPYDGFGIPAATRVGLDPDGNVYLTGSLNPNVWLTQQDLLVQRFDAAGTSAWQVDADAPPAPDTVGAGADAGGVVSGGAWDQQPGLLRYTAAGAFQWAAVPTAVNTAGSLYFDAEGVMDVGGTAFLSTGCYDTYSASHGVEIERRAPSGAPLAPFHPATMTNAATGPLAADGAGNLYQAGYFRDPTTFDADWYVSKLSATGTLVWSVTGSLTQDDNPAGVAVDDGGNVYVCETVDAPTGITTGLFKLSPSGALLWSRTYATGAAGRDGYAADVRIDGSQVYLAGAENDAGAGDWWARLWRIDGAGNVVWTTADNAGSEALAYGLGVEPGIGPCTIGISGVAGGVDNIDPADVRAASTGPDGTARWSDTRDSGAPDDRGRALAVAAGSLYAAAEASSTVWVRKYTENAAGISAAVSVVPGFVTVGNWVQIRLTVTNTGTLPLTSVSATLVDWTGGAFASVFSAPVLLGSLAPGSSTTFAWTVSGAGLGTMRFTLSASGTDGGGGDTLTAGGPGSLSVVAGAALAASLVATPITGTAWVGEYVTLVFTVSNTGGTDATGVTAALQRNAGSASVFLGPVPAGPLTIQANSVTVFTWTVSVAGSGTLSFTATAAGQDALSLAPVSGSATVVFLGRTRAALVGGLSVSPGTTTVFLGTVITIQLTVTNSGELSATSLKPSLQFNAGAGLVTLVSGPTPAGPLTLPGGTATIFTWTYSAVGSGYLAFTCTAQGGDSAGGKTTIAFSDWRMLRRPAQLAGSLAFSPPGAGVGQVFTMALTVTNTGEYDASALGPTVLIVSGAASVTLLTGPAPPGVPLLAAGASQTFVWTWSATAFGTVNFTVSVTAMGAPIVAPIGVAVPGSIDIALPAILSSTISFTPASATVWVGDNFTVTLTMTNTGGQMATSLAPAFGGSNPSAYQIFVGPVPPGPLSVVPGASLSVSWTLTATARTDLSVTVTALGDDGIGGVVLGRASGLRLLRNPGTLVAAVSVVPATSVQGNTIQVRVTVTNTGDAPVTGVTPALTLTTSLTAIGSLAGPVPAGPLTLGPGAGQTFIWTCSAQGVAVDTPIAFTGSATGVDSAKGVARTATATGSGDVRPAGVLSGVLTASPAVVDQGGTVTVVFAVTDTGGSAVWSVTPSAAAGPSPAALVAPRSGPVPTSLGLISAGSSGFFTWTYLAAAPGTVRFSATAVGFVQPTGFLSTAYAVSGTVLIRPVPLLTGSLAVAQGPFVPGSTVTVWLTVTNAGSATVWNVVPVLTPSPAGLAGTFTGPSPAGATIFVGGAQTFVWTFTALDGGPLSLSASLGGVYLSGTQSVASAMTPAAAVVEVTPRPDGRIAVYPNPTTKAGDAVRVSLRLDEDAKEVIMDVYDASLHRVWGGTWRGLTRLDGTLDVRGLSSWAPGVYLVRVRATLLSGASQVFPVTKLVVKP